LAGVPGLGLPAVPELPWPPNPTALTFVIPVGTVKVPEALKVCVPPGVIESPLNKPVLDDPIAIYIFLLILG